MEKVSREVFFEETQKFTQPLLWIVFAFIAIISLGPPVYVMSRGTGGWARLAVSAFILAGVGLLLFLSRLDVNISTDGIATRFFPLEITFRNVAWGDIASFGEMTVNPLKYGGWGLRMGRGRKAYIVSGKRVVELRLASGKVLLVGTREPERMLAALKHGMNPSAKTQTSR
jgi:hypothetical protein